jgi:hypothetical protein
MSSIFGSLFRSPNVFKNTFKVSNMNLNTKTTKHLTDLVAEHPDLDFPERRYLLPPVLKGYPWNPAFITGVTGLLLHNLYEDINLYYSVNGQSEAKSLLFFNRLVYPSMGPILSKRLTSISINFMGIIASQFDFIIVSTIHMILENRYKLYQAANSKTHEQLIRVTAAEIAIVLTTPTTVLLNLVYPILPSSESEWIRQYMAKSPGFRMGGFGERVIQYDTLLRKYEPGIVEAFRGGKRKNRTYRRKRTNHSRKNRRTRN